MASPRIRNLWILVEMQDHISGPPREPAQVRGNGCVGLRVGNGRPGWIREPVRVNPAMIHECKRARHHVRRPCEAGVISRKDRANGRRWSRRDENGFIVEVHGFDPVPRPSHLLSSPAAAGLLRYAHLADRTHPHHALAVLHAAQSQTRRFIDNSRKVIWLDRNSHSG